jgi:catechol 2,3-dioxygenase-like lactoylglutathione lyase family enzyme
MAVDELQHFNLRAADIERTREFYVNAVGLRVGPRPPIEAFGYWLYLGAQPVVHLVARPEGWRDSPHTGAIDHIAFHGVDYEATRASLRALGLDFREAVIALDGTRQLFVHDPDGVKIELNFDPPGAG